MKYTFGDDMETDIATATLKIEEAAKVLGISRNSAYAAAKSGDLPVVRLGKRMVVPKIALEKLLAGSGAASA
jgi:excisionase family DNA binding protein